MVNDSSRISDIPGKTAGLTTGMPGRPYWSDQPGWMRDSQLKDQDGLALARKLLLIAGLLSSMLKRD